MQNFDKLVNSAVALHQTATQHALALRNELDDATAKCAAMAEACDILQRVVGQVQQQAHGHICNLVTQCLQDVFLSPYEFHIEFTMHGTRTQATFYVTRDGHTFNVMHSIGCGVVDVISFALRLVAVLLSPNSSRILILDEPFKWVSECNLQRVAGMLQQLHDKLNVQFIMVTHLEALRIGTVIAL